MCECVWDPHQSLDQVNSEPVNPATASKMSLSPETGNSRAQDLFMCVWLCVCWDGGDGGLHRVPITNKAIILYNVHSNELSHCFVNGLTSKGKPCSCTPSIFCCFPHHHPQAFPSFCIMGKLATLIVFFSSLFCFIPTA